MKLADRKWYPTTTIALVCLAALACGESTTVPDFSFYDVFEHEEVTIEERSDETMLRLDRVGFAFGTADLTTASLPTLDKFALVFAAMPFALYSIEVHTDARGTESSNLTLSRNQADAVRNHLVALVGLPPHAFSTIGHGEALPIANNATAAGRAENRRVEIYVQRDPGAPVFRVTVSADVMDVTADCDDYTGSASAAAGDFYVRSGFYARDDRGSVLAARTSYVQFEADAGDLVDVDLAAEELFWASDRAEIDAQVDWFENDPGGVHQFDRQGRFEVRWNRAEGCWEEFIGRGTFKCLPDVEGEIHAGTVNVYMPGSASVDACIAELDWSIHAERIDR